MSILSDGGKRQPFALPRNPSKTIKRYNKLPRKNTHTHTHARTHARTVDLLITAIIITITITIVNNKHGHLRIPSERVLLKNLTTALDPFMPIDDVSNRVAKRRARDQRAIELNRSRRERGRTGRTVRDRSNSIIHARINHGRIVT